MPPDRDYDEADQVRDALIADNRAQRTSWTRWAQRAATLVLATLALLALGRELGPLLVQVLP